MLYQKTKQGLQAIAAAAIESSMEQQLKTLRFPKEEREVILEPIKTFAQEIRDGKVAIDQGLQVVQAMKGISLDTTIDLLGFEHKYVRPSELSDAEKQAARVAITRFVKGILDESIDADRARPIVLTFREKMVVEEEGEEAVAEENAEAPVGDDGAAAEGQIKFNTGIYKSALDIAVIRQNIEDLKKVADKAKIEDKMFEIDVAGEIQKAIDKGMKRPGGSADQ